MWSLRWKRWRSHWLKLSEINWHWDLGFGKRAETSLKIIFHLIGDRISFILDNYELFHLVHCTYFAHLVIVHVNTKSSNWKKYPIFLDSVISTELHCDVSPKSHLIGRIYKELFHFLSFKTNSQGKTEKSSNPHPFCVILAPVESDTLFWSWVIFLWVGHHPEKIM